MQEVIMNNIQPGGNEENTRFVIKIGGLIRRRILYSIIGTIVVIPCGIAFTIFWIPQQRIQMSTQPDESFHYDMKTVQQEVGCSNDQQSFPACSKQKKTSSIY